MKECTARPSLYAPVALALAAAVLLGGCDMSLPFGSDSDPGPTRIAELPRALTSSEIQVRTASNAFGFDLLDKIVGTAPDSSHFISPLSASMALGMTMNGARGETFDQMRATLRFDGLEQSDINASYRGLIDLLATLDPYVSFQLANSVWHRLEELPSSDFVTTVGSAFDAAVRGADFSDPATPGVINAWVEEKTGGRIDAIVPDPIPGDVVAYLLNAIHFQGDWTHAFDPDDTWEGAFHLRDGSTAAAQFMKRSGGFRQHRTSTYDAIDLPYGGQAYSMTVVIPRSGTTLDEVVGSMDAAAWETMVEGLTEAPAGTLLNLPRFTLEWERNLNETLEALGMPLAFTPAADFTGMFPAGGVFITNVIQKSFVRVDEEGTEAAAVTSVEMGRTSAPPAITADRPFLFAIRERLSGTILFVGTIVEAPEG